jgi:predicted lipoprotein
MADTDTAESDATTTTTTKEKKVRFSGKVVSVDTASNTLVVHGKADQTFTLTPVTKITGGTLAALTAGTKVKGTYTKSADGATLTLATLKITP